MRCQTGQKLSENCEKKQMYARDAEGERMGSCGREIEGAQERKRNHTRETESLLSAREIEGLQERPSCCVQTRLKVRGGNLLSSVLIMITFATTTTSCLCGLTLYTMTCSEHLILHLIIKRFTVQLE